jgi:hypothetical protein
MGRKPVWTVCKYSSSPTHWLEKVKKTDPLVDTGVDRKVKLKLHLKHSGLEKESVAGSCEYDNQPSGP